MNRPRPAVRPFARLQQLESRYMPSVTPLGGVFLVNPTSMNQAMATGGPNTVAQSPSGNFVVVWSTGGNQAVYAQRYDASGAPQGPPLQVVNNANGTNPLHPTVAMNAAGGFVVTWSSTGGPQASQGIYAQRYDATGSLQGSAFQVVGNPGGNVQNPVAAMDNAGDFVVTWTASGGAAPYQGVFVQRYDSSGMAQGQPLQITASSSGPSQVASVAMDAAGNFAVAWINTSGPPASQGLFVQSFNSLGSSQGAAVQVAVESGNSKPQNPALAVNSAGGFAVTWVNTAGGPLQGVYEQSYNSLGLAWAPAQQLSTSGGGQQLPAVAMDAAGAYDVSWVVSGGPSGQQVLLQRYNAVGQDVGTVLQAASSTVGGVQFSSAVAMDSAGAAVVSWVSSGGPATSQGVYAQQYNLLGTAQGATIEIAASGSSGQANPAVAMNGAGNFVVAWTANAGGGTQDVFFQRYDATGTPQGGAVQVASAAGNQAPLVAMDSAGDFLVSWVVNSGPANTQGVYLQEFNSNGQSQGPLLQVVDKGGGSLQSTSVAMDSAGEFVVAAVVTGGPASGQGVYAIRLNAAESPQSPVFQFATGAGNPQNVTVAMDAAGDFVATWVETGGGATHGVYAAVYGADGQVVKAAFQVASGNVGNASSAPVAMNAGGNFGLTWANTSGPNPGVYAQSFDATGTAQEPIFEVAAKQGSQQLAAVALDNAGNFVVSWANNGGNNQGVYAQAYNASGVAQGQTLPISAGSNPPVLALAADNVGNYVAVWNANGGGNDTILGQRLQTGVIMPVNPVPVNPVPVNPVPVNPVPVNPAPVNPAPVNPAPVSTSGQNTGPVVNGSGPSQLPPANPVIAPTTGASAPAVITGAVQASVAPVVASTTTAVIGTVTAAAPVASAPTALSSANGVAPHAPATAPDSSSAAPAPFVAPGGGAGAGPGAGAPGAGAAGAAASAGSAGDRAGAGSADVISQRAPTAESASSNLTLSPALAQSRQWILAANSNTRPWSGLDDAPLRQTPNQIYTLEDALARPDSAYQLAAASSDISNSFSGEQAPVAWDAADGGADQDAGLNMTADAGVVALTGLLASAGYMLLNTRAGFWALSLLTSRPLWNELDPLEVVYAWEKQDHQPKDEAANEESLLSLVE